MGRSAALDVAVSLLDRPAAVRLASGAPLPSGVSELLRVAIGEAGVIQSAQAMTGRSPAELQEAAGFFIEQILFHPQADYYRTLGAMQRAPRCELRQHMALLIKWLHPDGRDQRVMRSDLDRGIFIHRVTKAWEQLKTDERRAAYDQLLSQQQAPKKPRRSRSARPRKPPGVTPGAKWPRHAAGATSERTKSEARLIIQRIRGDSLLARMFSRLWAR